MSAPTPSQPMAYRNLLFGMLALQMDFIGRDALLAGMNAWMLRTSMSLGQILLEQGALRTDTHDLLEALVQKHLEMHGGDAEKNLAAIGTIDYVRQDLEQIADAELHACLAHVAKSTPAEVDLNATGPYSSDTSTESNIGIAASSALRFRVLRPHAKGGLGEVFVARDE